MAGVSTEFPVVSGCVTLADLSVCPLIPVTYNVPSSPASAETLSEKDELDELDVDEYLPWSSPTNIAYKFSTEKMGEKRRHRIIIFYAYSHGAEEYEIPRVDKIGGSSRTTALGDNETFVLTVRYLH